MSKLQQLFKEKPYLAWYIRDTNDLSEESLLEHIFNYGNWDDYKKAESVLGIEIIKKSFEKMTRIKRVNLRPQTINFFGNYFHKYA